MQAVANNTPAKRCTETCQIVVTMTTIPIYAGNFLMHCTCLGFQAEKPTSNGKVVVAQNDQTDDISRDELDSGRIQETPKRREIVNELIERLKAEEWKPSGLGEAWFSYRFERVSHSIA